MILKEFIKIVNYDRFCISKEKDGKLKTLCRINNYIPLDCLSEKLLNTEITSVFIDENFKGNNNDLINIVVKWGEK